ncbi:MAG: pilus (MSHA type) biogenesis protein MshL [Gammaproteobacteria bacterium]|nr:pilus (MSHA type) biogenesis protein MshL [Gammaproteobacteria bacterium]MCW8922027.1 pilus (MSHA type) biogenesis protein MshL [Gammaproteobacteria bacterium]
MKKIIKNGQILVLCFMVAACGASSPPKMSEGHLGQDIAPADMIPAPVIDAPILPEPEQRPDLETYTVIVNQVPVRELLFSMARDAKLNLDIDNDIEGKVTMNAIDQTLPQILERLSRQSAINYTLEDKNLHVRADKPYLQLYDVNYLNMSRLSEGSVEVATEISSTGSGEAKGGSSGGNNSSSVVENKSNNEFWKTLIVNIANVLGEEVKVTDKIQETSVNILVNRETGIVGVRATYRQHKQIQQLLDRVLGSAQRQVMIEATIAEVTLSDHYQAGIDWSMVKTDSLGDIDQISQNLLGGNLGTTPFFQISASDTNSSGDNLSATLKALETFGDVKVLSSPKVMALNNQTAMLKVVDNEVYFSIEVEKGQVIDNVLYQGSITTTINTVPIGFVMSVMPFIDKNDVVTLHVRPTISRIVGRAVDPNPDLVDVENEVPIIQVREIESVLKVNNGDTAVIGGLMQDQINKQQSGVPILSSIPFIGALFSYQDDEYVKSELVIFIRPVVVHDASLDGDLREYRKYLMEDFDATPVKSE